MIKVFRSPVIEHQFTFIGVKNALFIRIRQYTFRISPVRLTKPTVVGLGMPGFRFIEFQFSPDTFRVTSYEFKNSLLYFLENKIIRNV